MSKLYSTGPANIYIGTRSGNGASGMSGLITSYPPKNQTLFLGTCETKPLISIEPAYMPIKADIGGPMLPFDHLFTGEIGIVSGVLNKWNEDVYARLSARPRAILSGASGARGSYSANDIGSPAMLTGNVSGANRCVCLWIQFPYSVVKPAVYGADTGGWLQPKAYRFLAAIPFGPDGIMPGTPSRRAFSFWCGRVYKSSDGTWQVYDHLTADPNDVTNSLPFVPPVTADGALI